jgi:hypothetical protein
MTSRTIASVALGVALLAPSHAPAATFDDPNDAAGRLDIRSARFLNVTHPSRLRFTVRTFESWTGDRCRRALALEDGCSVMFWLDTRGADVASRSGAVDHWLSWRIQDCVLIDPDTLNVVASGNAGKRDDAATCTIRRRELDIRKKIRWFATTTWANPTNGLPTYSTDYAPDVGWYG